jgi:adenylylsulfate kinase
MVYWLIGISGAGKTTLGIRLRDYFENSGHKTYLIDGDEVRSVFDGDLGYNRADREANIKRIILAAYALDRCDITAIVCNISPFQHLRDLARAKIYGYNEIYIRKSLASSAQDDVKGVYLENKYKTDLVGVEIEFDEPTSPDLIIDADLESIDESLEKIIRYVEQKRND